MRRTSTFAVAAALALAAAGCGSSDNKSSGSSSSSPAPAPSSTKTTASKSSGATAGKPLAVRLENFSFNPNSSTVKVGQKVEWTNYDSAAHNVVATGGETFKSKTLNKGDKFEYTVDKPGTISYVCTFHPNMTATLKVTK